MSKFTFLTEEQCFGDDKLDILEKRGTKAAITDYAILRGGWVSNDFHVDNDSSLEGRTGVYWTKSDDGDNDARVVSVDGTRNIRIVADVMLGLAQLYRSHQSIKSPRTERVGKKQKTV